MADMVISETCNKCTHHGCCRYTEVYNKQAELLADFLANTDICVGPPMNIHVSCRHFLERRGIK